MGGIEGVAKVVDEVTVKSKTAKVVKPQASVAAVKQASAEEEAVKPAAEEEAFSFREALAVQRSVAEQEQAQSPVMRGKVMPATAVEPTNDAGVVSAVVSAAIKGI